MKTILGVVVGAVLGAALTFGYFKANPLGAEELAEIKQELKENSFDLDASKKAENLLREKVAQLKQATEQAYDDLAAQVAVSKTEAPSSLPDEKDAGENNFSGVMEKFGKAQADLAFKTLVESLGLEGAQLEAFTKIFDEMRAKKQAAFGKFMTGGLTLEELAMMEGYTPQIDEWVAANLDGDAQDAYSDYLDSQELNRVERKANEELTWLSAAVNLTPAQKDAAYAIFAEHQTRERPQDFMDVKTAGDLDEAFNKTMGSRYDALADVLDTDQLETYQEQSKVMGEMFKGFIKGSLEK